jgi:predicted transcriptional regulator
MDKDIPEKLVKYAIEESEKDGVDSVVIELNESSDKIDVITEKSIEIEKDIKNRVEEGIKSIDYGRLAIVKNGSKKNVKTIKRKRFIKEGMKNKNKGKKVTRLG